MSEAAAVAVAVAAAAAATSPAATAGALRAAATPSPAAAALLKGELDSSLADERLSPRRESSPRSKRAFDETTSAAASASAAAAAAFAYKMSPAASETSSALASGSDEYDEGGLSTNDDEGGGGGGRSRGASCSPTHKRRRRTQQAAGAPTADSPKLENGYPYGGAGLPYDVNAAAFGIPPIASLIGSSAGGFLNLNYERMLDSANAAAALMNHQYGAAAPVKNHKKSATGIESMDKMFGFHLNNNSMLYNNNNNSSSNNNNNNNNSTGGSEQGSVCGTNGRNEIAACANSHKKSMEDVLKKLTTKMNDSSIKEERRSHSPSSQRT